MPGWFEPIFEFLFKYEPFVFERGRLVLSVTWPAMLASLLLVGVAVPVLRSYFGIRGETTPRDRVVLVALRVAAFAVVALCLMRPALVVATAVPQQNFVGVLFDDSHSMRIADIDGEPRSAFIERAFGPEGSDLLAGLSERFKLRYFGFSGSAARLDDIGGLRYAGSRTDLARALDRARQELASLPVSGLVVISDGADNGSGGLTETINTLRDAQMPVFTVGLGAERFSRDIEIVSVEAPRSVLMGSAVAADVVVRQRGFDGTTVQLLVEDNGRIVSTRELELPAEGESAVVRAHFAAEEAGARRVSFRITPDPSEMVSQNNQRDALVDVHDRRDKILYFEGEPRWDVAFLRRAIRSDENLQVAILQRQAENKFSRYDVDDEEELFAGFPKTREELFEYRGLILGSIEADYFTPDQQRMMADFVSQRGGGFLALGGARAFSAGGWDGTAIAEVLPVVLDQGAGTAEEFAEVQVSPTLFGRSHPVAQLAETPEESLERWETLPPLSAVNLLTRTKPGAATLLEGRGPDLVDPQVVLAYQRYGAGKSIAFTVVDSWQWQMHDEIDLADMTHENLWRQLLRWLVSDVSGQVRARLPEDRFAPGEPVELLGEVFDDTYLAVNNAQVVALVESPTGEERRLPMEWTVEVDGQYRTSFTPTETGFHRITVVATRDDEEMGRETLHAEATELTNEFFGAEMGRPLLERIADETGGQFYTPADVDELPEELEFTDGGTTVTEVLDLWDMPLFFFLLVGLVGTEWGYRKYRKLP